MNKPTWVKVMGISVAVGLVANLLLMSFRAYDQFVFWIVLGVLGGGGWFLVKKT